MTEKARDRSRWQLTPDRQHHLNACAAQGMTLSAAATELGVHHTTLRRAIARAGMTDWLHKKFPGQQGKGGAEKKGALDRSGARRVAPEQIRQRLEIPNTPQTRWLAREWRNEA